VAALFDEHTVDQPMHDDLWPSGSMIQ
jgi:hypothetical protein